MNKNTVMAYAPALADVVFMTFLIATATVVIHESGHYATGTAFGCSNVEIVLLDESLETYTKMNCPDMGTDASKLLFLSGLAFTLPLAVAIMLFSKNEKYHAFTVFGFNLVISSSDFSYFAFLDYFSAFVGALLVIYGETLLVDHRISMIKVVSSYLSSQ